MLDFSDTNNELTSAAFSEIIDPFVQAENNKQTPRDYLGGSRLGVECKRALWYEFHHTPKDEGREFPAKVIRIFDMGHDGEERVASYLRMAGFVLKTEDKSGKQFEFVTAKGLISGHTDGVIIGGPDVTTYPCLWENKCVKGSKWREAMKYGSKKSHTVYYAQCQVYMAYMGLTDNPALLTMLNRDTGEILYELIPFNAKDAQHYSDKGLEVVTALSVDQLPRVRTDPTHLPCKWCDYARTCFADQTTTVKEKPSWL